MIYFEKDLSAYKRNGYKYTHVAIAFDKFMRPNDYEVGYKRTLENKRYNGELGHGHVEILTFRQAAAQYPENFSYE